MEATPARLFEIRIEMEQRTFARILKERQSLLDEYNLHQKTLSSFDPSEPWLMRQWELTTTVRKARRKVEELNEKLSRNRKDIADFARMGLDSLGSAAFGLINDNGETAKKYNDVDSLIDEVLQARSCSHDDTSFDDAMRGMLGVAIGVPYFANNSDSGNDASRLAALSKKIEKAGFGSHTDFYEMEKSLEKEKEKILTLALDQALRLYPSLQPFVDELRKCRDPYTHIPGKKPNSPTPE